MTAMGHKQAIHKQTAHKQTVHKQPMHWLTKSFFLVIVAVLAVLGLVGLVLPIIPGLVLLFLAVLLLTRISTRFNSMAGGHAGFRHLRRRWQAMNMLRVTDRIKLGFWYSAGAALRGVEAGVQFVQNRLRSRSSPQ